VLASCGFGSRRAMEEMILAGRITVNRMPAEVGQKVGPGDEVRINGELVKVRFAEPRARILMYHKPTGELVTRDDPEGRPTVFEKLPSIGNGKWINIGRLDYNTEGLLLFTNSGELANRLMHPRYEVEREYAVRIMGRLTDEQMQALTTGVELDDGPARCENVADGGGDEDGSNHWYHVVLKEGRNREVRRLFEALGVMVSRLIRTRYAMLAMPTHLKRGQLAELEAADVNALCASAGLRTAAGAPPRHERRDARASHDGRNSAHAQTTRPAHKQGQRRPPQEPGKPHHPSGSEGAIVRDDEHPPKAHAPARAHAGSGVSAHGHPASTRPRGKRRGRDAAHKFGDRPPHAQAPRAEGQGHGKRPPRASHNFDEVQPTSNANAAPFGRATLTVPGGISRGYGDSQAPRQRSGPRAHAAKFGKPNGNVPAGAHGNRDSRRGGAFNGPGRGGRPHARPRGEVDGNVAPGAEGSGAPAREANGNVAPREKSLGGDDDA
jgi:23S rRNA pseudouridine2605 synthase